MSAVLQVYQGKQAIARHVVDRERFVIGRGKRCSLSVDEDLVSREHVAIVPDDDSFWLEDLGSRNGTRLNGKKLERRQRLRSGDAVSVGSYEIIFQLSEDADDDGGKTVVHAGPAPRPSPSERIRTKSVPGRWRVRLKVVEGYLAGETFENWDGNLLVGRSKTCDVPLLSDEFLSQEHAEIVADSEDRYYLADLDSENGTFLNSRRVPPKERRLLNHGDKIRAGKETLLVFEKIDTDQRRQLRQRVQLGCLGVIVVVALAAFLRPPDLAGAHLVAADEAYRKGNLAEAIRQCSAALAADPRREPALAMKRELETRVRADELLAKAKVYAKEGKWDEAMTLDGEALRLVPKHSAALQLKSVLEAIQTANVALVAQNWPGAIRELEGASARFQNSEVITSMLELARSEQESLAVLVEARQALENQRPAEADESARRIPASSVYHPDAREVVDRIARARSLERILQSGLSAYRDRGDLEQASHEIEKGLSEVPGDPRLSTLRSRVLGMQPLQDRLLRAERLVPSDSIDLLLAGAASCSAVLELESDPGHSLARRAKETRNRIDGWLRALSESHFAQTSRLVSPKDDKEICRLLLLAVKTDPSHSVANQRLEEVRARVLSECREAYQKAYSLQGSGRLLEARELYASVTNRGLPQLATSEKDAYYEKALRRLEQLGNR